MRSNVLDEAEQCDDREIRIAFIKNLVSVVGNLHACLQTESGKIADIHAYNLRIDIDRSNDLGAMLIRIADRVLRHLAASILHYSDFSHNCVFSLLLQLLLLTISA